MGSGESNSVGRRSCGYADRISWSFAWGCLSLSQIYSPQGHPDTSEVARAPPKPCTPTSHAKSFYWRISPCGSDIVPGSLNPNTKQSESVEEQGKTQQPCRCVDPVVPTPNATLCTLSASLQPTWDVSLTHGTGTWFMNFLMSQLDHELLQFGSGILAIESCRRVDRR